MPLATELVPAKGQSAPALVLQLMDPVLADGNMESTDPAALLAQCLAARPDMQLRVQVQLLSDTGEELWSGAYNAGVRNEPALRLNSAVGISACTDLVSAVSAAHKDKSPDHSRDRGFLR